MEGKSLAFIVALLAMVGLATSALAYDGSASYTWDGTQPNYNAGATLHPGTLNTSGLIMGDFVGVASGTPNAITYGSSGAAVGWDDTWIDSVGDANTNGDALDGLWVQIYRSGGWWDLGAAYSRVAVFSSQDHGPYLGEGLEARIYGTNTLWDDTSLSAQASVIDVYLDGWRTHNASEDMNQNGWCSDDIAGIFQLDGAYRYVKLAAWGLKPYNEPEIDAVAGAPVPEPCTLLLVGGGLIGLAGLRRKMKG